MSGSDCLPVVCDTGFKIGSDGDKCIDVDECLDSSHGCGDEVCINTVGGVTCAPCQAGFELVDDACVDIDECALGTDDCGNHALDFSGFEACKNLDGGKRKNSNRNFGRKK